MTSSVSVAIDQKHWAAFTDYGADLEFIRAWLALQCQMVVGARRGWLFVLSESGTLNAIARYPDHRENTDPVVQGLLHDLIASAVTGQNGVAEPIDLHLLPAAAGDSRDQGVEGWLVALPLVAGGTIIAVSVIGIATRSTASVGSAMRQLQWGGGWVLDWLRRQDNSGAGPAISAVAGNAVRTDHGDRSADLDGLRASSLKLVAGILESRTAAEAAATLATRIAEVFSAERAAVGIRHGRRTKVAALSHAATAANKMEATRRIAAAMDEALDQNQLVAVPQGATVPGLVVRENAALAEFSKVKAVITVPLEGNTEDRGALTIERMQPLSDRDQALFAATAKLCGIALIEKRRNDRSIFLKILSEARGGLAALFGPRKPLWKLAGVLSVAALAAAAVVPVPFAVRAPVVLEAAERRVISAPFDGYIGSAFARAGDIVRTGDVLAQFDDADLLLQRTGLVADLNQESVRFEEAKANYKQAEAKVHLAQMDRINAELELVTSRIERAAIKAPFDGLVVSGDLSQSIGEPVTTGKQLFEIAPVGAHWLVVLVDERDIGYVSEGQAGTFVLATRPEETRSFEIRRLTPVLEAREGRNFYRVEAKLAETNGTDRPGLEGRGRIEAGSATTLWIWTRNLVNWVRLQMWAFIP